MKVTVDIICPKCSNKAQFHSDLVGRHKLHPDVNGKVICINCGFSGSHVFSNKDYFYQIEIGGRKLFAQNKENLITVRDFFQDGFNCKEKGNPELDFPKEFYLNKEKIVKQIDLLLERKID